MRLAIVALILLLPACSPTQDLQGHDPNEYYAKHPKVNTVEMRSLSHDVRFAPGANTLELPEKNALYSALRDVRPEAAKSATLQFSPRQVANAKRKAAIERSLRSFGFTRLHTDVERSASVGDDEAVVTLRYAAVVLPDCPDWRLSPVTTYSNTSQANFGCATRVNLGLMVADPEDLQRGQGDGRMDTTRNTGVIAKYRTGEAAAGPSATEAASDAANAFSGGAGQ